MTNAAKLPVAAAPSDERLRSRCLPLLSALARPGAVLMASGNPEDPVAIVVSSRADVATPSAAFAPEDAEAAASQGWIEAAGDGWGWKITRAGAAVVRAARASG
ncbi:MAG: hypothetical protein J0I75_19540, partial [Hyphomicrobium sp.]|nr:hypothetical protein [Hyphomicrobium sp.]